MQASAAGLLLLVLGAGWLVDAAVIYARYFGVSELVIGLTVVAVGTSLPEIAASLVAAVKGERDIAVGNAIGSSIYNILFTGYRINRWEGAVFLAYYLGYTAYVVMKATEHDLLEPFSQAMMIFVIPLTALTIVVLLITAWLATRKPVAWAANTAAAATRSAIS